MCVWPIHITFLWQEGHFLCQKLLNECHNSIMHDIPRSCERNPSIYWHLYELSKMSALNNLKLKKKKPRKKKTLVTPLRWLFTSLPICVNRCLAKAAILLLLPNDFETHMINSGGYCQISTVTSSHQCENRLKLRDQKPPEASRGHEIRTLPVLHAGVDLVPDPPAGASGLGSELDPLPPVQHDDRACADFSAVAVALGRHRPPDPRLVLRFRRRTRRICQFLVSCRERHGGSSSFRLLTAKWGDI